MLNWKMGLILFPAAKSDEISVYKNISHFQILQNMFLSLSLPFMIEHYFFFKI